MRITDIFKRFDKKKKYSIDNAAANEMLQNVFAAYNKEPNTIPFDKLVLRRKISTRSYKIGMFITAFLLLLTFLSPLAFPHSPAKITNVNSSHSGIEIVGHHIEKGIFYLTLSTDDIDYKDSYMVNADNVMFSAISFDEKTCTIEFPYNKEEVNIFIFTNDGGTLQLLLTPKQP